MGLEQLLQAEQQYQLEQRIYQIKRHIELKSSVELYVAIAQVLEPLDRHELLEIASHFPQPDMQRLLAMYLLANHFLQEDTQTAVGLYRDSSLSATLHDLISQFIPAMALELHEFMAQAKLAPYLFVRNLMVRQINYLDQLPILWQIPINPKELSKEFFFEYVPYYVALLRVGGKHPYLLQLWNDCGLLRRWRLDSEPLPPDMHIQPLTAYKQTLTKYTLGETGRKLEELLEQAISRGDYQPALLKEWLQEPLNEPLRLHGLYEKRLRETVQGLMKAGLFKQVTLETLVEQIMVQAIASSPLKHPADLELALYTLVQELILGTQNLKYRLNDCTRGIASACAQLASQQIAPLELLISTALDSLTDAIIEVYESFNLSDNTQKSFLDAFQQAWGEIQHQSWQQQQKQVKELLAMPAIKV